MTESKAERAAPLEVGGQLVAPGERLRFDLPAALLPTGTQLQIPITVVNGMKAGPRLWLSAAVHGDELNGVEIIRRVLDRLKDPLRTGAVIAVPIVNVFGFIGQSRYLPDRRDLNRCFPGSPRGSLASRMAHLFMTKIVACSTHGIDLHTASLDRSNLPQVRGDMTDPQTRRVAEAFGAPAMLHSSARTGSLRAAASRRGLPAIVFEGGESQRFNEAVIDVGVRGIFSVMRELGMISKSPGGKRVPSALLKESSWIRAKRGGLLRLTVSEGATVEAGQDMGTVADPFGADGVRIRAPFRGLVIGKTNNPVVHGGDPLIHLGRLPRPQPTSEGVDESLPDRGW